MGLSYRGKKHHKGPPLKKRKSPGNEYAPSVLLTTCPRCQMGAGDYCVSVARDRYGPKYGKELSGPHPERVALARGPKGL